LAIYLLERLYPFKYSLPAMENLSSRIKIKRAPIFDFSFVPPILGIVLLGENQFCEIAAKPKSLGWEISRRATLVQYIDIFYFHKSLTLYYFRLQLKLAVYPLGVLTYSIRNHQLSFQCGYC
jgi:hypothetical protein